VWFFKKATQKCRHIEDLIPLNYSNNLLFIHIEKLHSQMYRNKQAHD